MAAVAAAASWWGGHLAGREAQLEPDVVVPLGVLGIGGVLLRERNMGPHLGVSVISVVLAAAVALTGPTGAALVGCISYLADLPSQRLRNRLFNAAMTAAMGAVGGLVYLLAGGDIVRTAADLRLPMLSVGLPLLVAYVAMTLLNFLAIGLMAAAVRGSHVLTVAIAALRTVGWGSLSQLIIGFLFVVLWVGAGLGALSALFVLGPLVVAHWTIGRAAMARREHQETVTTFVAALEQTDPGSVGHSVRVADLADGMGAILDLGGQEAEDLRYAALLHDIGLVAVRSELHSDMQPDDISYLTAISSHPEAGVAVLRGMDFLTGALPAIAHHHERFDGRGYPAGLAGGSIPLAARIIAVADAYDALTAEHVGAPLPPVVAVAELRRRAGTQFDPLVVEALVEFLSRAERGSTAPEGAARSTGTAGRVREGGGAPSQPEGHWNHDHPAVSDTFADWQPEPTVRTW